MSDYAKHANTKYDPDCAKCVDGVIRELYFDPVQGHEIRVATRRPCTDPKPPTQLEQASQREIAP